MKIVLFCILLYVIICIFAYLFGNKSNTGENLNTIVFEDKYAKYLGGFPDIAGGKKSVIAITGEHLIIQIKNIKKIIPINDIINAEIMSERQIESRVSLGKLALVGVLSLGMKSSKTVVKNYLVITLNEDGEKRDILIETNSIERMTREIRKVKSNQIIN